MTANHTAASNAGTTPIARKRAEPHKSLQDILGEHWEEEDNLLALQRKLEDVALRALDRMPFDYSTEAIEEADAGWLHEVFLRRAIETLPPTEGGDA